MWDGSVSARTLRTRTLEPAGDSKSTFARALSRTRVDDPYLLAKPFSPPELAVLHSRRPATALSPVPPAPTFAAHSQQSSARSAFRRPMAGDYRSTPVGPPGTAGPLRSISGTGPFGSLTRPQLATSLLFRASDSLGVHSTHLRKLTPVERRREDASRIRPVYTAATPEETRAAALQYLNGHGVGIKCSATATPPWSMTPMRAARAAPGL